MSAQPPILIPAAEGSGPIVYAAYSTWSGIAQQAFATAQLLASQLANIPITTVNFNANFDPQIALPGFPNISAPPTPEGLTFNAPTVPGAPPIYTVPILPAPQFVSDLLTTMQNAVQTLLGGNPLPPSVARQLRDRSYTEANTEEVRAVDQAYDEYASRGFFTPSGILNKQVSRARADARMRRQATNRDIYIQEQMVAIENLRFAVTSGIQLEGMQVEVFKTEADVQVEIQRLQIDQNRMVLDEWRAQVELYNTQLQAETTRIDVLLREFQSQVELYKASAQVATAAGAYDERRFQLNLSQEQAIVDTEMKRADQQFQQLQFVTNIMLEIKKTLAQVSSSLASAAMSAVNIGASLSSQTSEGIDYSLRMDYYGQLDSTSSS